MKPETARFARTAAPLATVALLARIGFFAALPRAAASNDLGQWAKIPDALAHGVNPYTIGILAWPPLWMLFLAGLDQLSRLTSIEFTIVLRSFLILVDVVNILLALRLASRYADLRTAGRVLLVGMALNPIELFLLCQHGNFDALVVTTLLLFALMLLAWRETADAIDWLFASLALGIGVLLKTIPLLLAPILALHANRMSKRAVAMGSMLLAGPAALGISIIYVLTPEPVMRYVLRYRSYSGWFGITGILDLAHLHALSELYASAFPLVVIVAFVLIVRWLRRTDLRPEQLVLLIATMLAALIAFGPGYGAQYIAWPLPFFVITYPAFDPEWKRDLLTALAISVATYVVEYGLTADLGQLFVVVTRSPALQRVSDVLADDEVKTLVRLPLFATYVWLVFAATRRLKRSMQGIPQ